MTKKLDYDEAKTVLELIKSDSPLLQLKYSEIERFFETGDLSNLNASLELALERLRPVWKIIAKRQLNIPKYIGEDYVKISQASRDVQYLNRVSLDSLPNIKKVAQIVQNWELKNGPDFQNSLIETASVLSEMKTSFEKNRPFLEVAFESQLLELEFNQSEKKNFLLPFYVLQRHETFKIQTPIWVDSALRELSLGVSRGDRPSALSKIDSKRARNSLDKTLRNISIAKHYSRMEEEHYNDETNQPAKKEYLVALTANHFDLEHGSGHIRDILRKYKKLLNNQYKSSIASHYPSKRLKIDEK